MPRSPSCAVAVAVAVNPLSPDDDDDNDICPVCDGDCTCNNRSHPTLSPIASHGNACFAATPTASIASSAHTLQVQPLKIKLTVPPNIQKKARSLGSAPKKSLIGSDSASLHRSRIPSTAGHGQHSSSDAVATKRRGRHTKVVVITHDGVPNATTDRQTCGNEVNTLSQSQSHLSSHTYAQQPIASQATRPRVETSKLNLAASRRTAKSQAKGTIAKARAPPKKKKQDRLNDASDSDLQPSDDTPPGRYPTFVSADGLTSEASDSSDSESDSDASGFGSDSSLKAEEENYIVAQQRRRDKARVRRELLGDDIPKHKDSNNNWVIRPRKKSVDLNDTEMEGDSDDITEDEDEDEEMEEEEEEEEADGQASGVCTGLATGWSDDEESSFDADLFFANLTDTSSDDDDSSETDSGHLRSSTTDPLVSSTPSLRNVDFEVTEAWDGQVVFTNGSNDGHGVLDLAFEANAAQLIASDGTSISHDSDVEMCTSDLAEDGLDDHGSELASDGDTTEEELVDEQGFPTSRAMRLFQWPTSVSSINPMSTVSPNVSPTRLSRRDPPPPAVLESPRPADILAGKVFWEETDQSQQDSAAGSAGESPRPITRGGMPIMGQFYLEGSVPQKTAVLTGINEDLPSPYPCIGRRRRRFSSSAGSFSSMDLRGRTARLSIYPSLPPPSDEPSSEAPPGIGLGEPIKLDDVLDSTLLDSEPETQTQSSHGEGEQRLAQSLSRWDRVPVGAFRLTRESVASPPDVPTSPGWTSEPSRSSVPDSRSYRNVLKSSPLHAMLWHDKSIAGESGRRSKEVLISPVLLPVHDDDRAPTHVPYHYELHSNHRQHTPFKNRKESRREMKATKRKTHPPASKQYDRQQRHHRRNHHPNMKTRGNASVQRTFFSSPISAPALNI